MVEDTMRDAPEQSLREIAWLLQQATEGLWAEAERDGPGSPLPSLALGAMLAAATASGMAAGAEWPGEGAPDRLTGDASDPVPMLQAAERLTRGLSPDRAGVTDLCVAVADLLREARGYAG